MITHAHVYDFARVTLASLILHKPSFYGFSNVFHVFSALPITNSPSVPQPADRLLRFCSPAMLLRVWAVAWPGWEPCVEKGRSKVLALEDEIRRISIRSLWPVIGSNTSNKGYLFEDNSKHSKPSDNWWYILYKWLIVGFMTVDISSRNKSYQPYWLITSL